MKTLATKIAPLEWNEAQKLDRLLNSATRNNEALVIDPRQGVTGSMPTGLISPNDNINGSVRFDRHYQD